MNPEWYEQLDPTCLTEAEWIEGSMGRPPLSDAECISRATRIDNDFARHKFRPGEHYDRYLTKLLDKYEIVLREYYWGCKLKKTAGSAVK